LYLSTAEFRGSLSGSGKPPFQYLPLKYFQIITSCLDRCSGPGYVLPSDETKNKAP
jgi:hypothetical protein